VIGIAVGLAIAAGVTRLLRALLFGVDPLDPITFAIAPVVLAATALLASYLPARRAVAVEPVEALRAD
jgi:ABC-type lipoprotein release transport system permease subunit